MLVRSELGALPAGFSTGTYGDRLYADAGQAPGFVLQIGTHPQLSSVVEGELKRALVSDVHGDDGPAKQIQYGTEARSGARVKFMPIAVAVGELEGRLDDELRVDPVAIIGIGGRQADADLVVERDPVNVATDQR